MYPILLKFGRIEIYAYGVMLAISFLIGIYWSMYRSQRRGIDKNHMVDLSLIVVICAILGSRFLYVITHLDEFRGHWGDTINPFQSSGKIGIAGLTMLGGVVFAFVAIVIFCRVKKIPLLKLLDILAPIFGLGIFLTRIGCFLNGCCFGKPCDLPWCMVFPVNSPAGSVLKGLPLHPSQLYSSFYGLVILIVLLIVERKKHFDGFVFGMFFILYGIFRFMVDFVRYYEASVQFTILGTVLTINQAISFFMFVTGFVFILYRVKRG